MKTKFCLTKFWLTIAGALLALTAFSYGQVGTDVNDAAKDTAESSGEDGSRHGKGRRQNRRGH